MKSKTDCYSLNQKEMILRDYLAADRTVLANERTLLAYIRTFIALIASGAGLVKLFEQPALIHAGIVLVAVSPIILVVGVYRFVAMRGRLNQLNHRHVD